MKELVRACMSQYLMAQENLEGSNIRLVFAGDQANEFWFMISGITGDEGDPESKEFEGGVYLGKIRQTDLRRPPLFMMYTPNGVIAEGTENVCTVISKYHPQNYRPELKIYGFITNMMGALKCWRYTKYGIGLLYDGNIDAQHRNIVRLAKASMTWNRKHHPEILEAFDEQKVNKELSEGIEKVKLEEAKQAEKKEDRMAKLKAKKNRRGRRRTKVDSSGDDSK